MGAWRSCCWMAAWGGCCRELDAWGGFEMQVDSWMGECGWGWFLDRWVYRCPSGNFPAVGQLCLSTSIRTSTFPPCSVIRYLALLNPGGWPACLSTTQLTWQMVALLLMNTL